MDREIYRDHLDALQTHFGDGVVMVTLAEAAKYLHKDARSLMADRTFPIKNMSHGRWARRYVVLINLARWLAK